jgi:hypothetical protein
MRSNPTSRHRGSTANISGSELPSRKGIARHGQAEPTITPLYVAGPLGLGEDKRGLTHIEAEKSRGIFLRNPGNRFDKPQQKLCRQRRAPEHCHLVIDQEIPAWEEDVVNGEFDRTVILRIHQPMTFLMRRDRFLCSSLISG